MAKQPEYVLVDHEHVSGEGYSRRRLEKFTAVGSRFERCRFEAMHIDDASMGSGMEVTEYLGCSFDGSVLRNGGGYARFVGCSFRDSRLIGWRGHYLEFIDCVFSGRIESTVLWGVPPEGAAQRYASDVAWLATEGRQAPAGYRELVLREHNEIRGNDLSGAELHGVDFKRGVALDQQQLPTGPGYLYLPDAETAVLRALAAASARPADALSTAVERLLRSILDRDVKTGQRQILMREGDFVRRGSVPPYVPVVFGLLRAVLS